MHVASNKPHPCDGRHEDGEGSKAIQGVRIRSRAMQSTLKKCAMVNVAVIRQRNAPPLPVAVHLPEEQVGKRDAANLFLAP